MRISSTIYSKIAAALLTSNDNVPAVMAPHKDKDKEERLSRSPAVLLKLKGKTIIVENTEEKGIIEEKRVSLYV